MPGQRYVLQCKLICCFSTRQVSSLPRWQDDVHHQTILIVRRPSQTLLCVIRLGFEKVRQMTTRYKPSIQKGCSLGANFKKCNLSFLLMNSWVACLNSSNSFLSYSDTAETTIHVITTPWPQSCGCWPCGSSRGWTSCCKMHLAGGISCSKIGIWIFFMKSFLHGSNVVFHAEKASFIVNLCCLVLAAPNGVVVVVSMFAAYSTHFVALFSA